MQKILIIKIGALGDVVRTTPLLHVLKGEITWVTKRNAFPLLKNNPLIACISDVQTAMSSLSKNHYDLVFSLDEDLPALEIASNLGKTELIGAYSDGGKPAYTESSAEWFDMGLISRYGKKAADEKKWQNRKSYQEIVFDMLGKKFKGEEYILPALHQKKGAQDEGKGIVGLETRSGDRWVGKRWSRYPELMALLKKNEIHYLKFRSYPTLQQFLRHVDKTSLVVTTDSLAMHLALALGKKVISLFTCTSFHEIYDYGRMIKVVSPLLERYFYSTEPTLKSGEAIEPERVLELLLKLKADGDFKLKEKKVEVSPG